MLFQQLVKKYGLEHQFEGELSAKMTEHIIWEYRYLIAEYLKTRAKEEREKAQKQFEFMKDL